MGVTLWTCPRLLGLVAASHSLAANPPSLFPTFVQEGSSCTWSCVITSFFFFPRRMTQSPSIDKKCFCCVMEEQSWKFLSTLCSLLSLTKKLASIHSPSVADSIIHVSSALYTREGVEISLSSSADVILVLFFCIVLTIDVFDLKSWSVTVFIVGIIFVNPYLLREPWGS